MSFYSGGYSKTGQFAYIPDGEEAFQEHTGIDPVHIIHYANDEYYDKDGNLVKENE